MTEAFPDAPYLVLVEDDDVDAMAVERGLRKLDCRQPVHRLYDGEQALRFLHAAPPPAETPLVLLVDINLPRMNGLELIRELRRDSDYDDVPIFVLTTSKLPEDRAASLQLEVAGYITKDDAALACRSVAEALLRAGSGTSLADAPWAV